MDLHHRGMDHNVPEELASSGIPRRASVKINNTVTHLQAYSRVMAFKAIGRQRRKAKEREERGTTHGVSLAFEARVNNYLKQTGAAGQLTARQLRRVGKKARREALRG